MSVMDLSDIPAESGWVFQGKPMDNDNIIINIKSRREFDVLMKRLEDFGYPIQDLIHHAVWEEYQENFCVRLAPKNKVIYHDRRGYYERDYGRYPILTVEQYYSIYDKGFVPVNLNRNLINAIKGTQNAS